MQIAEAAKLKPMEVELKRLEDLSEDIVKDFSIMRKREEEMRNTNGNKEFILNRKKPQYSGCSQFLYLFNVKLTVSKNFSFFWKVKNWEG